MTQLSAHSPRWNVFFLKAPCQKICFGISCVCALGNEALPAQRWGTFPGQVGPPHSCVSCGPSSKKKLLNEALQSFCKHTSGFECDSRRRRLSSLIPYIPSFCSHSCMMPLLPLWWGARAALLKMTHQHQDNWLLLLLEIILQLQSC